MFKILVSGKSKGSGKTTFIEKIIKNLRGNICVIKSSIHNKYNSFDLIDDLDIIEQENTDTYLFSKAGADKVYYLTSNKELLKLGIENNFNQINDFDYLIVEGNSIIDFINFDLIYYLDKKGGDKKLSAEKCKNESDVIVDYDNNFNFRINVKKISCLKAHEIGHSFNIPLKKIGNILNRSGIKVNDCQLGLF